MPLTFPSPCTLPSSQHHPPPESTTTSTHTTSPPTHITPFKSLTHLLLLFTSFLLILLVGSVLIYPYARESAAFVFGEAGRTWREEFRIKYGTNEARDREREDKAVNRGLGGGVGVGGGEW